MRRSFKMQKKDFFLCGFTGWCLEILWTGLHSLVTGHFTMMGKTSLLMFPVYGLAALIRPAYYKLARFPVMVRGIIYSCGIFFVEFFKRIFFFRSFTSVPGIILMFRFSIKE